MLTRHDYTTIAAEIRRVVDDEALTRFRRLHADDITEKNPGDLVTVADRRVEERLTAVLERAVDGSVTVGEEAAHADPGILGHLRTDTPVWIIDPIDGTANFVAGDPHYACLVSLARSGRTVASWIYAPSLGLTAGAHTGHGAWIDDRPAVLRHRPHTDTWDVVTTHHNYTAGYHHVIDELDRPGIAATDCSSAGLSYVELVRGEHHALVYTWENPWDHAAGLHLHAELGGTHTTMDGGTYRLAGGNALPFIVGTPDAVAALRPLLRAQI